MFADISVTKLLIVLVIIIALFGTKKLKSLGKDLGGAVKGFKDAMGDAEKAEKKKQLESQQQQADAQAETAEPQAQAQDQTQAQSQPQEQQQEHKA